MSEVYGGQKLCECCGVVITADRLRCDACTYKVVKAYSRPAPVQVPAKKPLPDLMMASYHEAIGWNACVDAMLAVAPSATVARESGAQVPLTWDEQMELLGELAEEHPVGGCALPRSGTVAQSGRVDAEKVMALAAVPEYWLVTLDDGAEWKERNAAQALNLHSAPHVFTVKPVGRVELPPELRAKAPAITNQEPSNGK